MKKGFTLIELLIVIGIIAILATVVVLVLNPAQILAQARDSQRISDLSSVKSAVSLYLSTATNPIIYATTTITVAGVACPFASCSAITYTSSTVVTGAGWVPIDFTKTSGGSPLAALPSDPSTNPYAYMGNSTNKTFKVEGQLESTKYSPMMTADGGNQAGWYEVGTDLSL